MDNQGSPIRDADENVPTQPNSFSAYLACKSSGEAAVLAANKAGFRTIALRPPAIWGPGDMFSQELPQVIKSGQFGFINRGDYPVVICHVDNLIEAINCALASGTGGRAYFVNDEEKQTFREFIGMIASVQNLSIEKLRSIPYPLAFGLGRLMESLAAITFKKSDPPLSRSLVRMIVQAFTTSDAAARRELGYAGKTSRADGLRSYKEAFPAGP